MNPRGRPLKYADFIKSLDSEQLYAPIKIVKAAMKKGFFSEEEFSGKDAPEKARTALQNLRKRHIPNKEDGFVMDDCDRPLKAWYGWRWKTILDASLLSQEEIAERERYRQASEGLGKMNRPAFSFAIWRRFRTLVRTKKRILAICLLATPLFAVGMMVSFYPQGLSIYKEQGATAALKYYMSLESFKRDDPVAAFGRAWSEYAIGNYKEAEIRANELLRDNRTPEVTVGNIFFLLGKIKIRTGPFNEAREHFDSAVEIFQGLERHANLYKTYCALAYLSLNLDNVADAQSYIDQAYLANEIADMDEGEVLHLQAKLAFHVENYEQALSYSWEGFEARKKSKNRPQMANVLADISFYLFLTGQEELSFQKAIEAQILVNELGDTEKGFYNFVNFFLLNKCSGKDTSNLESAINKQIQKTQDWNLKELFEFAVSYTCPLFGGEDDDTPPPNEGGEGDNTPPPNEGGESNDTPPPNEIGESDETPPPNKAGEDDNTPPPNEAGESNSDPPPDRQPL